MNHIKLKEIAEIKKGNKVDEIFQTCSKNYCRFIQIDDLRSNDNLKYCVPTPKDKMAQVNDIIIAWDGANAGTLNYGLTGIIGSTLALLQIKSKEIHIPYLGAFLKSQSTHLRATCTGATIPHISRTTLESISIPLPPLETQKQIAEVLDKADELRQKRKQANTKLDEFLQSVFLDMFGDPVRNPKGWEVYKLTEFIDKLLYGTSTPPIFAEIGTPFIRATNIKKGRIVDKNMLYIDKIEGEKIKKCLVNTRDILIVRSGVNTGDSTFIPEKFNNSYGGYDLILRLNHNLNHIFLVSLFNSIYREIHIDPLTRRAAQPHLNAEQVSNLEIYCPPLELQNKFAQIVEKVEDQKMKNEASAIKLDDLFNSLLQRAFKGELEFREEAMGLPNSSC